MKINKKHCFLLLMLSLIFILAIGITSATEITNETAEIIKNNQEVSTIDTQTNVNNEKTIKHTDNNKKTKQESYIYVSSNGNSTNQGTNKSDATTLSNALTNAQNGQTILLTTNDTQDIYKLTSEIRIDYKNINFKGENGKTIIFDGQQKTGIFNIYTSTVTLNNIQLINSKSSNAAITTRNSDLTLTSTKLKNNIGTMSGAILSRESNLTIKNSVFTNNTSEKIGGAILQVGNKTLSITGSTFTENRAKYDGGSVYSIQSKVQINSSTFTNNHATNGGALYLGNNVNKIQLQVINSQFNNNKATKKGDSIWTNYDIQVTNNDFVSTNNNNWIYLDKNNNNNINQNWWSSNSPNFEVITDGVIPDNWKKEETYLSINNLTTKAGNTINFNIVANKKINDKVTLKVNNVTLSISLTNGKSRYSYTVPKTWKANNYTTELKFTGNKDYASKTVYGYLLLENPTLIVEPLVNNDLTLNTKALPASYDLREHGWVTPVKSQGSSGSCWAFSSLASLESVLLKKTGVAYDLSENNMKNVLKKYSVLGDSQSEPNSGFNDLEPIGYLVGWYGPVNESEDIYSSSSYISPVLESELHVQDVYIIPKRANTTDNYWLKQAVYQFGAVSTGIYKPLSTNSYTTGKEIDHSVTIVGWDDNYSRTNFSPNPPGNGAFIVKNSWGTSTGINGYHYISYYDESIGSVSVTDLVTEQLNYVVLMENKDNYTDIYQYDVAVNSLDESSLTDFLALKNIYTASKDEKIAAIGTYFNQISNYTIEIYTNNKLVYTQTGKVQVPGYRTIRLNNYVSIANGEEFTVVVKMRGKEEKPVYLEYTDLYYSSAKKGTSFLSFDGKEWESLYEYECVAPIKVYTKDTPLVNSNATQAGKQITVTTKINNIKSQGYLTYYLNNQIVKVDGKTLNVKVSKNSDYTVTFNDTTNNKKNIITTVFTSENYAVKENITVSNPQIKESKITVSAPSTAFIGDKINITGTLSADVKIANTNIIINIDNRNYTTSTDGNGNYKYNYQLKTLGNNKIQVYYLGNNIYSTASNSTLVNVVKKASKITVSAPTSAYNGDTITVNGTLSSGVKLGSMNVVVNIDNKDYSVVTDSNGNYKFSYQLKTLGNNKIKVSYLGNNYYSASSATANVNVIKKTSKILLNASVNPKVNDEININGSLTANNNYLPNESLTIIIDGVKQTTTTDKKGIFTYNYKTPIIGTNNITVLYNGNSKYTSANKTKSIKTYKVNTILTVDPVNGIIGENIKLVAHIKDKYNHLVSGGNLAFKLNGKTLRSDGRFDSSAPTWKFSVNNGVVSVTIKADIYLRNAKNLTATYSGSYKYNEAKSNTVAAQIKKRNAKISLTATPKSQKHYQTITFTVTLKDITPNSKNKTAINSGTYVVFKINGVTIKDAKGNAVKVAVKYGKATYKYIVPRGMGGIDKTGSKRNYVATCILVSDDYYPDTKSATIFNVERSPVSIIINKVTVNKNNKLSIKATIKDYKNVKVLGKNNVNIKINGKTYVNPKTGKVQNFEVFDGVINFNIDVNKSIKIKLITIVTGARQAYLGQRNETKNIKT